MRLPSRLVRPITWPPGKPAPANTALHTAGKWSRPCCGLIFGVRPKSPSHNLRTLLQITNADGRLWTRGYNAKLAQANACVCYCRVRLFTTNVIKSIKSCAILLSIAPDRLDTRPRTQVRLLPI